MKGVNAPRDSRARSTCLATAVERAGQALEEFLVAMVGREAMTTNQSTVLEFPAWLHGTIATIRRKVRAEGKWWAREYIKTGAFPQPRQLRQMQPGEVLVMHSGAEF